MAKKNEHNLDNHGLGRIYVPDTRDFKMSEALARFDAMTPMQQANAKMQASHSVAKATKEWAALVTLQLNPNPGPQPKPTPTPTPDPTPTPTPPSSKIEWQDDAYLDQKDTGHCVGFGWTGWRACDPIQDSVTDQDGHDFYYLCKIVDGEPKAEDGSSVRSGAKVAQQKGLLSNYVFTTKVSEVIAWIQTHGPVVFGTDWYNNMFNPDTTGVVALGGGIAGGHCYLGIGYDPKTNLIECRNSWSKDWSKNGNFFIDADDMQTLLTAQGEACAATELLVTGVNG